MRPTSHTNIKEVAKEIKIKIPDYGLLET